MFYTVTDGKRSSIFVYLSEIQTSVETIEDAGLLDHTAARLLPIVTSLSAHLTQLSNDDEINEDFDNITEDFDNIEQFAPSQKMKFS